MYKNIKVGLSLSGGGYRAAAFHLGTLKKLHQLGLLQYIDVISAVSGGAIVASYYMLHKDNFEEFETLFKKKLKKGVMEPVFALCGLVGLLAIGLAFFYGPLLLVLILFLFFYTYFVLPINQLVEWRYRQHFYGNISLKDIPKHPILAINATDTEFGKPFVFTRDMIYHSEYRPQNGELVFSTNKIPLAKAVMASSCIPIFNPVKIGRKEQRIDMGKPVYLMDGGLFDNQGIHRLSKSKGRLHTMYNIISNAGNTKWNPDACYNIISSLYKGMNILMKRIQSMQNQHNMYLGVDCRDRFAFFELDWENSDRAIYRFVDHLEMGNISEELIKQHNISAKDVRSLREGNDQEKVVARDHIAEKLKENIGWSDIVKQMPLVEERKIAVNISTNLTALSEKKIDVLMKQASWMTEMQVRIYLPSLLN